MTNRPQVQLEMQKVFGFDTFLPGQEAVIEHLLAGRSALAVFPTGGGKSLCYQLPALLVDGMTLVVSPLIALMKDQIDFLVQKGVAAARLDSSLPAQDARRVWDDLWNGSIKLLYVAPERFASERFLQRLRRARIGLMAVDEAHCISEWGHNFRPDYMKLAALSEELGVERVLALTATASPAVADDIRRGFKISPEAYVNAGFHRPNLTMRTTPCAAADRDGLLLERLRARPAGAAIVYVTLQKTAERVATFLAGHGLPARAYHAGMEGEDRHAVQEWFMASADAIVVATIAFGMGIDKADIRYVYHYNLPKSLENYMQETGRAGRDGLASSCDLLVCPDDIATLENFTYGDTPTEEAVKGLITEVLAEDDAFDVSVYELSTKYDIRTLVLSTLFTYLELDGILASTGPFYNEYRFQPRRSSAEILADFPGEEARLVGRLLARSEKARTWFSLDIAAATRALGETRQRLVGVMNGLEERGDLTLKVAGLRRGYRFLRRPDSAETVTETLIDRFREAEARDIGRTRQVVDLGSMVDCTVRHVLSYFGEVLRHGCGHCDRCLGEPVLPMPPRAADQLTPDEQRLVADLRAEGHEALAAPRQLARFLCGLTSPATSRAGLTRDRRFGRLAHHRFATVMGE